MNAIHSDTGRPHDERAVLQRTESVMRILDGRSTVVKEAARHHVDVAEVDRWLRRARIAVAQAMRGGTSTTGNFVEIKPKSRHATGVFWASGSKK